MDVIRGINLTATDLVKLNNKIQGGTAVTIGNFDGVHLGHQDLFNKLFKFANNNNLMKVCITFEPSPKAYFQRNKLDYQHHRLTLITDKLNFLRKMGFDLVWIINFNHDTANIAAHDFVTKIIQTLRIKFLVVGRDFRFGKNRAGDFNLLKQYAGDNNSNFVLEQFDDYLVQGRRVASSLIKELLTEHKQLELGAQYLGRYYGFTGKVKLGQQTGRTLGYPTINIHVRPKQLLLESGVYAVQVQYNQVRYNAMANWGVRPTIGSKLDLVLEAHLFDFNQEIYDQKVYIEFIKKIREEKKFNSLADLKNQLAMDASTVQQYFSSRG